MDNYIDKKCRFVDFKHALEDMSTTKTNLSKAKFAHLKQKVLLANAMGIDDFPGEKFEQLAVEENDQ